jgi:hypothetical protein
MVIVNFPTEITEMETLYNENVNNDSVGLKHVLIKREAWMELNKVTTKELQGTLKVASAS